jgi:hypothetical protein
LTTLYSSLRTHWTSLSRRFHHAPAPAVAVFGATGPPAGGQGPGSAGAATAARRRGRWPAD